MGTLVSHLLPSKSVGRFFVPPFRNGRLGRSYTRRSDAADATDATEPGTIRRMVGNNHLNALGRIITIITHADPGRVEFEFGTFGRFARSFFPHSFRPLPPGSRRARRARRARRGVVVLCPRRPHRVVHGWGRRGILLCLARPRVSLAHFMLPLRESRSK